MKPGRKISFEENARRCLVSVHDRPVLRDVAHWDNGQSNHSFLSKAEQTCERISFRQINKKTGNRIRPQGASPRPRNAAGSYPADKVIE
jgi:hypothetical protein